MSRPDCKICGGRLNKCDECMSFYKKKYAKKTEDFIKFHEKENEFGNKAGIYIANWFESGGKYTLLFIFLFILILFLSSNNVSPTFNGDYSADEGPSQYYP